MRQAALPPDDPAEALQAAVAAGLRWLGQRELSETGVRERLGRRAFLPATIDEAIARLQRSGALDERRAVRAVARTLVLVKRRGRLRARRELETRGFSAADIDASLTELLSPDDERAALERAVEARIRRRPPAPGDAAASRRLFAALVRQGYPPAAVGDVLRRRLRTSTRADVDASDE